MSEEPATCRSQLSPPTPVSSYRTIEILNWLSHAENSYGIPESAAVSATPNDRVPLSSQPLTNTSDLLSGFPGAYRATQELYLDSSICNTPQAAPIRSHSVGPQIGKIFPLKTSGNASENRLNPINKSRHGHVMLTMTIIAVLDTIVQEVPKNSTDYTMIFAACSLLIPLALLGVTAVFEARGTVGRWKRHCQRSYSGIWNWPNSLI